MYQRILVATDDSRLSRRAEKAAIGLAAATGANLVALHVVPEYPMSFFEGAIAVSPQDVSQVERAWAAKGRQVVDRVVAAAHKGGVEARGVLTHSDRIAESIMGVARKHKCDLIVMASHGRRGVSRVLLGSETQQVLTHSKIPVLVLR